MADQRVTHVVRLSDPTTSSQMAAVDSSGRLSVSLTASSATVTVDTEFDALADGASYGAGTKGILILGQNGTTDYQAISVTAAGLVNVADGGGSLTVDGTVAVSGTVTVDTEFTALQDADSYSAGSKGMLILGQNATTDYQGISVNSSGRLQVDVISGGGSTAPTNPVSVTVTSSAVAAGASANLDTADIASKYLWQVDITSSVPFKAVLSTLANGVAAPVTTLFGKAGSAINYRPPHQAWALSGSTAGADGFRVAMTNMDTSEAADIYATFLYADN